MSDKPKKAGLRSVQWFGRQDIYGFIYRSWTKNRGIPHDQFDGRPVIGICNTYSELTPCNSHFRTIAEHVKAGVLEAGGFPLEFPVMSLGETLLRPTAMLYRNLASMDVEESIRANPIDGVVLLVGCDKTTPALLMGAASCDLPAIAVSGGPMLNGNFRGQPIGSGTHVWKFYADVKAGTMPLADFMAAEQGQSRSAASCRPRLAAAATSASSALFVRRTENRSGLIRSLASRRALACSTSTSWLSQRRNWANSSLAGPFSCSIFARAFCRLAAVALALIPSSGISSGKTGSRRQLNAP